MDAGLYLADYSTINIYFMKEVLADRKRAVPAKLIKHLFVPQYKNLTMARLLDFARLHPKVFEYLPDERDIAALPRQVSVTFFKLLCLLL